MNGNRVVHLRTDSPALESRDHPVAVGNSHDEEVRGGFPPGGRGEDFHSFDPLKALRIALDVPAPRLGPVGQVAELDIENRRLKGIESRVEPRLFVDVLFPLSEISPARQGRGQLRVVGGNRASVPVGAEILSRVEAEGASRPEASGETAVPLGEVSLGGVFDEGELSRASQNAPMASTSHSRP